MPQFNARFTLKNSKSDKKEIVLRLYYENKTFSFIVKDKVNRVLKIYPPLWDKNKQYPLPKSKIPPKYRNETYNIQTISETIDQLKVYTNEVINEAVSKNRTINNDLLRSELNLKMGFCEKKGEITLHQFCLQTINEMETGVLHLVSTKRYAKTTIDKYRYTAQILEAYNHKTTFSQINVDWYNGLIQFLTQKQSKTYKDKQGNVKLFEKKELEQASVGSYIKNLKFLMKYAVRKEVSNNKKFTEEWFIRPQKDSNTSKTDLALSEEELKQIFDFQTKNSGHNLAKDLFLIGCFTGLRVSDFNTRISNNDFVDIYNQNNEKIKILLRTLRKTSETVYIPLLWDEIKTIFEKYNYNMPMLADQTINDYIKLICKEIDSFSEKMQWNKVIGGKNVKVTNEKWEMVTNHSGRRSFISNMIKRGFTESEIGYLTGHKNNSMISKYDKLSGKQKAILIYNKFQKSQQKNEK